MRINDKGFLISIEGIDGTGKTSLAKALAEMLEQLTGESVVRTGEPYMGKRGLGDVIRKVLATPDLCGLNPRQMTRLFSADRSIHIDDVIVPSLMQSKMIVCDRYTLSTLAYQGRSKDDFLYVMELVKDTPISPDLTIVLTAEPEKLRGRLELCDSYELNEDLQRQANKVFNDEKLCSYFSKQTLHLDAMNSMQENLSSILFILKPMLGLQSPKLAS